MSKIGKLPIQIKEGIKVDVLNQEVKISGPKGQFTYTVPEMLKVSYENGVLKVMPKVKNKPELKAVHGLTRALLANMVKGVDTGFEKKLELHGVGYRAQVQGGELVLSIGYSHPVRIKPEEGVTFSVSDNVITVSGINKEQVGNIAAKIRSIKPPEPYKGKGIRYVGEQVRKKAGKAAKAVGGK